MTLHLEQIVVSEEGQSGFREGQSFLAEIANKWNHQVFRKHYIIAIGASSEPIFSDYVSTTLSVFVWSDWEIKLVFCRRQAWLVNGGRKCYRNPFYQVATRATFIGQPIFQLLLGNQFANFHCPIANLFLPPRILIKEWKGKTEWRNWHSWLNNLQLPNEPLCI